MATEAEIEERFLSAVDAIPKGCLQCYETANLMFKLMVNDAASQVEHRLGSVKQLDISQGIVRIELTIKAPAIMKEVYETIKNPFWHKRLFMHAFNILIVGERVWISQSWFQHMDYAVIDQLTTREFVYWLADFDKNVTKFAEDPLPLFYMFKAPLENPDVQDIVNIVSSHKNREYDLDVLLLTKSGEINSP